MPGGDLLLLFSALLTELQHLVQTEVESEHLVEAILKKLENLSEANENLNRNQEKKIRVCRHCAMYEKLRNYPKNS